ncbi:hypothetical protein HOY80DRAFT_32753, partial [Tuber brumale]
DWSSGVTGDFLDKDRFWKGEVVLANKDFLFEAGLLGNVAAERSRGISGHAYSALKGRGVKGMRFALVRCSLLC